MGKDTALSSKVVAEDHDLEVRAERTAARLAKHRWHWTLDESNPDRVAIRQYARDVNRSHPTILAMVNGYAAWSGSPGATTLSEAVQRAKVSAEKEIVVDAIADAEGVTFKTASTKYDEIRDVQTTAQERAERKGTTIEEEVPKVAEQRVKARKAAKKQTAGRKARMGGRYIEIEGHLAAAQNRLTQALQTAEDVEWDEEHIELLVDSLAKIRAVLNLIDMRIAGETDVDWDAELASLTKEA